MVLRLECLKEWKATTPRWEKRRKLWRRSRRRSSPLSLTALSTLSPLLLHRLVTSFQLRFFWLGWEPKITAVHHLARWTCQTTPTSFLCFSPSWSRSPLTPPLLHLALTSAPLSHRFFLHQRRSLFVCITGSYPIASLDSTRNSWKPFCIQVLKT